MLHVSISCSVLFDLAGSTFKQSITENTTDTAPDRPLEDVVAEGGVTETDVDLHLSTLFPFVRLRNYIEIRCFDSVPWPLARSVLALVSGLVYCTSAAAEARVLSERVALRDPGELRQLHLDAARLGLETGVPGEPGVTFRDLAGELVEFSAATLGGSTCDWAQPRDLDEVRELLAGKLRPRRAPGA